VSRTGGFTPGGGGIAGDRWMLFEARCIVGLTRPCEPLLASPMNRSDWRDRILANPLPPLPWDGMYITVLLDLAWSIKGMLDAPSRPTSEMKHRRCMYREPIFMRAMFLHVGEKSHRSLPGSNHRLRHGGHTSSKGRGPNAANKKTD
jgi:hypothetical protein